MSIEEVDPVENSEIETIEVDVSDVDVSADVVEDEDVVSEDSVVDVTDQLMRLRADFDNFRRRTVRERSEVAQRANETILTEMLSVIDHMELAIGAGAEHDAPKALTEGFQMVCTQMVSALEKFGLSRVNVSDTDFDPNIHEAISQLPSEDVAENGIIECTRSGYMLGDKLLRAAQVVISSGSSS